MTAPDDDGLDERIDALTRELAGLADGDPGRPALAGRLGQLLAVRCIQGAAGVDQRDRAVALLSEAAAADTDPERRSTDQVVLGMLLFLRALPGESLAPLRHLTRHTMSGGTVDNASLRSLDGISFSVQDRPEAATDLAVGARHLSAALAEPALPGPLRGQAAGLLGLARMLDRRAASSRQPGSGERSEPGEPSGSGESSGSGEPFGARPSELMRLALTEWGSAPGATELGGLAALAQLMEDGSQPDAQTMEVVDRLAPAHVLTGLLGSELGLAAARRAEQTGAQADVLAPAPLFGKALASMDEGHPLYLDTVRQYAGSALVRAAFTLDQTTVDEAIEAARKAVAAPGEDDPATEAHGRYVLGAALTMRAMGTGRYDDLSEAIEELRRATAAVTTEDPFAQVMLASLGGVLLDRYQLHGGLADLDASIGYLDRSAAIGLPDTPLGVATLNVIRGFAYVLRGARQNSPADLEAGADMLTTGMAALPPTSVWRARATSMLGLARLALGALRRDLAEVGAGAALLADTADAVVAGEAVVDGSDRASLVARGGMARVLQALFESPDQEKRRQLFDAGIARVREALAQPGFPTWERGRLLGGLGMAYQVRAEFTGVPADLDAAIDAFEEVYFLAGESTGYAVTAAALRQLSMAYWQRGYVRATASPPRTPTHPAAADDPVAGGGPAGDGDPASAADDRWNAIEVGLEELRAMADEVLLQTGVEDGVRAARGAAERARDLAGWCRRDGRPEALAYALTALELGRGLVLHTATAAASVVDLLNRQNREDLAGEWASMLAAQPAQPAVRQVQPGTEQARSGTGPAQPGWVDSPGAAGDIVLVAEALLGVDPPDDLRLRVLAALGDRYGLREPPTLAELTAVLRRTGADALVFLVPGDEPGDRSGGAGGGLVEPGQALVLRVTGELIDLPLPHLIGSPVARYLAADQALRGLDRGAPGSTDRRRYDERQASWRAALDSLCDWAWAAAVGPLLDLAAGWRLGREPRLTLIPYGALGVVPWHAARTAGQGPTRPRYAVREAIFSYAASGRSLVDVARRTRLPLRHRPVLVGDPAGDTGVFTPLLVAALRDRLYPDATVYGRTLGRVDGDGTPDQVLGHLPGSARVASMLHLGCHGHLRDPVARSYLALAGGDGAGAGRLPVERMVRQAMARPAQTGGLVVLSSCESDRSVRDYDEALTLATTFLATGATDVIGSRWPVRDVRTAIFMYVFHDALRKRERDPAGALRAAQVWMTDPDRSPPLGMPDWLAAEAERAAGFDLTHVESWAAFAYQGIGLEVTAMTGKDPAAAGSDPITALVACWDSVVALLGPGDLERLRSLYQQAPDAPGRRLALIAFLLEKLPVEHPVRRAAADDSTTLGTAVADPAAEHALSQLAELLAEAGRRAAGNEEIALRVRERLLAVRAYTADELTALRGSPPPPGVLCLVAPDGSAQFPAFQFNQAGTPLPVVLRVNDILRADRDPWGVADWWVSVNGWLAEPPAHLLGMGRDDDLVAVAHAVRAGV